MMKRVILFLLISPSVLALEHPLQQRLGISDAVFLLQRVGIGAEPLVVNSLAPLTRAAAIEQLVKGIQTQPSGAMPEWVNAPAPAYWARGDMPRESGRAFNQARDREMIDLRRWWVAEMINTPSPQTERLVLMWHNHFVSAYSGINQESTSIARQNQMFRKLGLGNFRQMLQAIIRDPAMLNYLDNRSNKKRSPNENLARELLEIFTLDEGNYTEGTVKEAARALTGYTVAAADDMSFVMERWHHDKGNKTLFGHTGAFNGDDLIDIILQQDAAAKHIARLFWRHYISEFTIDETAIDELAANFRDNDYELRGLLLATLQRPEFWAADYRGQIVKSPVDLLIGSIRSTGVVPRRWDALPAQLARLGQALFDPPNVAGWKGGAGWVTPARLLNRQQALTQMFGPPALQRLDRKQGGLKMAAADDTMASLKAESEEQPAMNMMAADSEIMPLEDRQSENQLTLRVAAENFRGAPEVQLVFRQQEEVVWRSEPMALSSGHDTEQYGRIAETDLMPWETLLFELPTSLDNFDGIDVHFLNDAAGDGGDRNLYVDWLKIRDRHFYARDGLQNSGCPPKESDQAGNLYCKGYVGIPVSFASAPEVTTVPADELRAAHAHTWWFQPLKKGADWRQLVIGLTDVQLDMREWNNITISLISSADLGSGIEISTDDCVPDCLINWPECAWTNEVDPAYRSLFFPVKRTAANDHLACHWESLSTSDQRLIGSLFSVLPQLVEHVSHGRKAQRRRAEFSRWMDAITKIGGRLDPAYQAADAAKKLVLTGENISAATTPQFLPKPVVGGRAPGVNASALKALMGQPLELPLLLSAAPVLVNSNTQDVSRVMTDPAYQIK